MSCRTRGALACHAAASCQRRRRRRRRRRRARVVNKATVATSQKLYQSAERPAPCRPWTWRRVLGGAWTDVVHVKAWWMRRRRVDGRISRATDELPGSGSGVEVKIGLSTAQQGVLLVLLVGGSWCEQKFLRICSHYSFFIHSFVFYLKSHRPVLSGARRKGLAACDCHERQDSSAIRIAGWRLVRE